MLRDLITKSRALILAFVLVLPAFAGQNKKRHARWCYADRIYAPLPWGAAAGLRSYPSCKKVTVQHFENAGMVPVWHANAAARMHR